MRWLGNDSMKVFAIRAVQSRPLIIYIQLRNCTDVYTSTEKGIIFRNNLLLGWVRVKIESRNKVVCFTPSH